MNLNNRHIIKFLLALLLLSVQAILAQRIKVPVDLQIKVIPKILSLNKNFSLEKEDQFNFSILYSNNQRNSKQIFEAFKEVFDRRKIKIKNQHAIYHSIEVSDLSALRNHLRKNKIRMLYLTPIRGFDISKISRICKEEQVLTITGVEEYVENDVSVIFGLLENKLKIYINRKSAKQEGVNFSSRLLKIAKIIE